MSTSTDNKARGCKRIINFGVKSSRKIDVDSESFWRFAEDVSKRVPSLTKVDADEENGTLTLFESGGSSRVREIRVEPNGIQCAAGSEVQDDEQLSFMREVAVAAEVFDIPKLSLEHVDLRYIFRITHHGNHHDLIASVLWAGGPLKHFRDALETPFISVDTDLSIEVPGHEDVHLALTTKPRTSLREVRTGNYDGDPLDIGCGVVRFGGFATMPSFDAMLEEFENIWTSQLEEYVMKYVVQPLTDSARESVAKDEKLDGNES